MKNEMTWNTCYTDEISRDGLSTKRQMAIDMVRLVSQMKEQMHELGLLTEDAITDISNVECGFTATLPKADREELRHG